MQRQAEISPGKTITYFKWDSRSYKLPNLNDRLREFGIDLWNGFQQTKEEVDDLWPLFTRMGFPNRDYRDNFIEFKNETGLNYALEFYASERGPKAVIQTELIGWVESEWAKNKGKSNEAPLYVPNSFGTIEIVGLGQVGGDWILGTQGHHTIPFS